MTTKTSMAIGHCTEAEWQARCELAALYRVVAHFRMTDLIDTHISARVPGAAPQFLINRYGVLFHEMRARDLVRIDLDGRRVDGGEPDDGVNAAGFTIHSAIHAAREDVACVIHTHTAAGIAVSAQHDGLLPLSQHALKFYGRLGYHDYEGIALDLDERERLVRDLGPHMAMILRNHGLLAVGRSIAQAFDQIYFLERACQAQVQAMAGGAALRLPPEHIRARTCRQYDIASSDAVVDLAWRSVRRLVGDASSYCC
ncbi:class II aldolase/adducin family protein [Variovorax sp. J22P271]|uniref:class II aldolase/adducin family protein n=1 Tax=Variovorax davisae TaxID=3053515 RepID=UPI0025789604|nr:class II aldolase/adducin family protein [Variovorax sp. J22P271]MDM0031775.1 class II aldolase/adducin family protein [Variovorax sp. J22P271]